MPYAAMQVNRNMPLWKRNQLWAGKGGTEKFPITCVRRHVHVDATCKLRKAKPWPEPEPMASDFLAHFMPGNVV